MTTATQDGWDWPNGAQDERWPVARPLPPGAEFVCTLKAGTRIAQFGGYLVAVHPDDPPMLITSEGLRPL